jgi:aminoglycoside phosphotransferase (APT) family kinase protein
VHAVGPDGASRDTGEAKVVAWLQDTIGGDVVGIRRQARWRPAWYVDVRRGGRTLSLYVRGERSDMPPVFPLRHEMRLQQQLEDHGIPVPHVHGFCEDPTAIVMDREVGSVDFSRSTDDERQAVMEDYIGILARMHALDVGPFVKAGAELPADLADVASTGMRAYERVYRGQKKAPDPFPEFGLAWLDRNPSPRPRRASVVVWDSGQFMHRDGRVVALLDLELTHIGDPLMDLAGFRMRDSVIGYGDLRSLYRRYEEQTGEAVDLDAIDHYHFAFALTSQLALHGAMVEPLPDTDLMTYMQWCSESNLYAVEALADMLGVPLDDPDLPPLEVSAVTGAHRHLVRSLRGMAGADEQSAYRLRIAFRLARHLERYNEIGAAVTRDDLDDLGPLLGHRPSRWEDAEAELEAFVRGADPDHDRPLVRLFHRRLQRRRMLLGPSTSAMARHLPLQPIR